MGKWDGRLIPLTIKGDCVGDELGSGIITLTINDTQGEIIDKIGIAVTVIPDDSLPSGDVQE